MNKKAVVGMSGGVDSSVCAYLLKQQGYDVIGVTMQMWQNKSDDANSRCVSSAADDARSVALKLGIPFYVLDFKAEFKKYVVDYFVEEYLKAHTPNPCIACNRYVKWEALLNKAIAIGADYIATGHYARVTKYPKTNRYTVQTANTAAKDQTYALYKLTQFQLAHTLMPIGDYEKQQVRTIAKNAGLSVANKADSQDICFIPNGDYASFIHKNTKANIPQGNFVDSKGNVLGVHKGITNYTIGQRKGFGISFNTRMFVTEIRPETNEVVLDTNDKLFKKQVLIKDFNYMAIDNITAVIRCSGKLRYSQKTAPCTIYKHGDKLLAEFDEPQRAPTPGQAAVFYDGDYVLGGGTIC